MTSKNRSLRLALFGLALVWCLFPAATARAHGGGEPQLTNAPVGPYLLSAWTSPEPPVAGDFHLSFALALASTGAAVTDAEVEVLATTAAGEVAPRRARATTTSAATSYFYEADLSLPATGLWTIEVQVESEAGGGQASFQLQVVKSSANPLLLGIAGVMIVVSAWLAWLLLKSDGRNRSDRQRKELTST